MVRHILLLCFFLQVYSDQIHLKDIDSKHSLVYSTLPSRFGDCLISYIWGKWANYTHDIDFCYCPFPYSDQLILSKRDFSIESIPHGLFENHFLLTDFEKDLDALNTLYLAKYKFISYSQEKIFKLCPDFMEEIRKNISPLKPLDLIYPPNDITSVALHIRKGGGYDEKLESVQIFKGKFKSIQREKNRSSADLFWPLKFPPEQYYIDQLQQLSEMLCHRKMYVYIFTDDKNPLELTKRIKEYAGLKNIEYDCRYEKNHHDKNVLIDFFSMQNFDCIIRGTSSYSRAANLLGNFDISIFPTSYHWEEDEQRRKYLIVDNVTIDEP